jgi:hypothetical protein
LQQCTPPLGHVELEEGMYLARMYEEVPENERQILG